MDTKSRIKELMDERGWTIYELSKRSGLAQTTISNMWKRNTEPTVPSLRVLCDAFGITLSQFFADNDLVELSDELKEVFENWRTLTPVQKERIPIAAHLSGGSLGTAANLLKNGESEMSLYKKTEEFAELLLTGRTTDALVWVNSSLPKDREKTRELLTLLRFALRDLLAARKGGELLFFTEIPDYARRASVRRILELSEAVVRAENDIAANGAQVTVLTALVCGG